MDMRHEDIILETDRYRSRLSDYVNQRDREFFALNDATVTALDAPEETRFASFLMVARTHVRIVALAAEEKFGVAGADQAA